MRKIAHSKRFFDLSELFTVKIYYYTLLGTKGKNVKIMNDFPPETYKPYTMKKSVLGVFPSTDFFIHSIPIQGSFPVQPRVCVVSRNNRL